MKRLLFLLLLIGCQPEPTCTVQDSVVKKKTNLATGTQPTAYGIDQNYIYLSYTGFPCDSVYLGYAVEVRTLPPQYYVSLQGVSRNEQLLTQRFDIRQYLGGTKFHFADTTLVKPHPTKP